MSKKIFFGNYKGGVGKTTTVFEVGAVLANEHNKKVLLIDLDSQCSLSKICAKISGGTLNQLQVEKTLNFAIELYSEYVINADKIDLLEEKIKSNYSIISGALVNIPKFSPGPGKLDYIPTVLDIKNARLNDLSERLSKDSISVLSIAKLLNDIDKNNEYDYILFDCPPSSNTIIQGTFLSCDYYLIPTIGDEISSDGVADYITEIESTYLKYAYDNTIGSLLIRKYFGDKPKLIGILPTMYKVRKNADENTQVLEALDKAVAAMGTECVIKGTSYAAPGREYIFNTNIPNLDNRSNPSDYGIPITISNGDIHRKYYNIVNIIVAVV